MFSVFDVGFVSLEVEEVVQHIDAELERLWKITAGVKGRKMVITADHGHVVVRPEQQMVLQPNDNTEATTHGDTSDSDRSEDDGTEDDGLLVDCLLHRPTVEPRSPCFHVKPGREDDFARLFRSSRFGRHFALLPIEEAVELRLFGPQFTERAAQMAGSFIALTPETRAIVYERPVGQVGMHGGMTQAEVQIPLIIVSDGRAAPSKL